LQLGRLRRRGGGWIWNVSFQIQSDAREKREREREREKKCGRKGERELADREHLKRHVKRQIAMVGPDRGFRWV
jgi:hypothetical protein